MDDKKTETVEVKYTAQDFQTAYLELSKKMGYAIVARPSFAPTNHQTWEFGLDYIISELPKENPQK